MHPRTAASNWSIYVWDDVFDDGAGKGLAVAVASSLESAQKAAAHSYAYDDPISSRPETLRDIYDEALSELRNHVPDIISLSPSFSGPKAWTIEGSS